MKLLSMENEEYLLVGTFKKTDGSVYKRIQSLAKEAEIESVLTNLTIWNVDKMNANLILILIYYRQS